MTPTGTVAVVAGVGTPVGLAVAEALGRAGHTLLLADDSAAAAEAAARTLGRRECLARPQPAGTSLSAKAEGLVTAATEAFGRIDVLAHCASAPTPRSLARLDQDAWADTVTTGLAATWRLARAAVDAMLVQGTGGAILWVTPSDGLLVPTFGLAHGAAFAGATVGLVRALSAELRNRGVAVNGVLHNEQATEPVSNPAPDAPRGARSIGELVAFLATPGAANITGRLFVVDGPRLALLRVGGSSGALPEGGSWTPDEVARRWKDIVR